MNSKVRYFEDMACRKPKFLGKEGYRNLYVVRISYLHRDKKERTKRITLPYGSYRLAANRYDIETSVAAQPDVWLLDEIRLTVETYLGTDLLHSDDTLKVKFGHMTKYGNYSRNRIGEVIS